MHEVTLIRGDGIGPEIIAAALTVLEATGVRIAWEEAIAGEEAFEKCGTPLPEETIASLRKNKVGLKGPLTTQVGSGYRSLNVAMRQKLDPVSYTHLDVYKRQGMGGAFAAGPGGEY